MASVFAVIIQDKEDECLMVALRSLANDGWRTHSLQQDGLLVECGERAGNAPAVPLYLPPDPVTLASKGAIANAERAIEMAKGLRIGLLEKPFYDSPEVPAVIMRFALHGTDTVGPELARVRDCQTMGLIEREQVLGGSCMPE